MTSQSGNSNCVFCGDIFRGRTDKRFCNDHCRNSYNNQLNGAANNLIRNINNALGKNRRILKKMLPETEVTVKVNKEKMIRLGFHFKYLTHSYTTRSGKTYFYCYDYGWLALENDWFLIVKWKEKI